MLTVMLTLVIVELLFQSEHCLQKLDCLVRELCRCHVNHFTNSMWIGCSCVCHKCEELGDDFVAFLVSCGMFRIT
eukprot:1379789-Amphidinium_carterae.1